MRKVEGTRYYYEESHAVAFALPEFASAMFEGGEGCQAAADSDTSTRAKEAESITPRAGFVAKPAAGYIARDPKNETTVGMCRARC